jgi:hypothetical protein
MAWQRTLLHPHRDFDDHCQKVLEKFYGIFAAVAQNGIGSHYLFEIRNS